MKKYSFYFLLAIAIGSCKRAPEPISRAEMLSIVDAIRKDNPEKFESDICPQFAKPPVQFIGVAIFKPQDTAFLRQEIRELNSLVSWKGDLGVPRWERPPEQSYCYHLSLPLISPDRKTVVIGIERRDEYSIDVFRFSKGKWHGNHLEGVLYNFLP